MKTMADRDILTKQQFIDVMLQTADIKQWRKPSPNALRRIFDGFPENSLTKQPFIDAEHFYEAVDLLSEAQERTVPGDIKRFYQQVRREQLAAIVKKPELPPALDTHNLKNQRGGEEYVRFKRLGRQLKELRREGRNAFSQAEYDGYWDAPLTDLDWALASNTSPAQAIAAVSGGKVPAPDPKEVDVVWV